MAGEILLYMALAMLTYIPWGFISITTAILLLFMPNMKKIDRCGVSRIVVLWVVFIPFPLLVFGTHTRASMPPETRLCTCRNVRSSWRFRVSISFCIIRGKAENILPKIPMSNNYFVAALGTDSDSNPGRARLPEPEIRALRRVYRSPVTLPPDVYQTGYF